jgi:hypothetical protein
MNINADSLIKELELLRNRANAADRLGIEMAINTVTLFIQKTVAVANNPPFIPGNQKLVKFWDLVGVSNFSEADAEKAKNEDGVLRYIGHHKDKHFVTDSLSELQDEESVVIYSWKYISSPLKRTKVQILAEEHNLPEETVESILRRSFEEYEE